MVSLCAGKRIDPLKSGWSSLYRPLAVVIDRLEVVAGGLYADAAMQLLPAAGPRNPPLPWSVRLVALAWVQLAGLVLWTAYQVVLTWWFLSPEWAELTCLDRARPACETHAPAWALAILAAMAATVLLAAVAALVVARRHHRGRASHVAAISTLTGSFALAAGVEALLWYVWV
jgi:hypothetical protein